MSTKVNKSSYNTDMSTMNLFIKFLFNTFLLSNLFISCQESAVVEDTSGAGDNSSKRSVELDGRILYEQNCLNCHGTLLNSDKTDATASEISRAIDNVVRMNGLNFLTESQIQELANSLSSKDPSRVSPNIISAAPSGKHPGATASLKLQISTDLPSVCYYDSLDVTIENMKYQLSGSGDKLDHEKTLSLTPGASYEYFIHCKDNDYGNITKVSQRVTFSTDLDAIDETAPRILEFYPKDPLLGGTTKAKIYVNTNESATCKYSSNISHSYAQMSEMDSTGSGGHSEIVTGLQNGNSYTFYFICLDAAGNTSDKEELNLSVLANVNGPLLYQNNCQSCHGNISSTGKRNSSVLEINNAIRDVGRMQIEYLELLSDEQVQAISDAL